MTENNELDIMRQIIEKKKQKSASQGSIKRGPEDLYGTRKSGNRKRRKESLLSEKTSGPGDEV